MPDGLRADGGPAGGRGAGRPAAGGGKADPWKELAQAGLLSLCLPPDLGGDGLGVLEAAVLLTEIGRRAAPVPALATLMTGVLPVVRWGDADLRRALLPGVAAGETILTAAIREPSDPMPEVPAVTVTAGTVTGTKVGVPYCAQASRVLVPVSFPAAGAGGSASSSSTRPRRGRALRPPPPPAATRSTRCGSTGSRSSASWATPPASGTCTSWRWPGRAAWPTAPWPRPSR